MTDKEIKFTINDMIKYVFVLLFFIVVWVGFFGIISTIVNFILVEYAKDSVIAAIFIYVVITLIGLFLIYSTDSLQYLI